MVEAAGTLTRDQIKDQLMEMVNKHIEARNTYSEIEKDEKMGLRTTMTTEENKIRLTVTEIFAEGLTIDELKE